MNKNLITDLKTEPFPLLTITNLFSEEERALIFNEIKFLGKGDKLLPPAKTGSACNEEGTVYEKNTKGVSVDQVYSDPEYRRFSDILNINRNVFDRGIMQNLDSWFFKNLEVNFDGTIVSYYGEGSYYKPHKDNASLTALSWFYEEPKYFTGGDLVFPDYNITIPTSLNTTIMFPSCIKHEVTETHLDKEHRGMGRGRYVMAQLAGIH
jgi:hypothetical protein